MLLDKNGLRIKYKDIRNQLEDSERFNKSVKIGTSLFNHPYYQKAKTIGFYVSLEEEVETILLIEEALKNRKRICVPKVEGDEIRFYRIKSLVDLQEGTYNIYEPTTPYITRPNKMDLIVVPMIGFNKKKYRLGYGGGYYDRYLKDYKGHTIGLAFDDCLIEEDFQDEHDLPMELIITEDKIY